MFTSIFNDASNLLFLFIMIPPHPWLFLRPESSVSLGNNWSIFSISNTHGSFMYQINWKKNEKLKNGF